MITVFSGQQIIQWNSFEESIDIVIDYLQSNLCQRLFILQPSHGYLIEGDIVYMYISSFKNSEISKQLSMFAALSCPKSIMLTDVPGFLHGHMHLLYYAMI